MGRHFTFKDSIPCKSKVGKQKPRIAKTPSKGNKVGGLTQPHIKIYYKVTVIKSVGRGHNDRQMVGQRRESRRRHTCKHLVYEEGSPSGKLGGGQSYNKWCWVKWIPKWKTKTRTQSLSHTRGKTSQSYVVCRL